jgi:two-component system LytT family response regulator
VLRVLIVDDEHLARQAMRRLLASHPEVEIVGEAEGVADALQEIERTQPQLVFLDIELSGGDGFDVLAALERPPMIVFVTAYAEYAVEAFAVNAVDYLLKPVEPERLAESLTRADKALANVDASASSGKGVIALKTPKRTVLAQPDEIVALRADGDFTHVFVADQPALMMWRTLAHFESVLPSPPFLRLGRSLIGAHLTLRSARSARLEGWEPVELLPSFETPRFARLLRMRFVFRNPRWCV